MGKRRYKIINGERFFDYSFINSKSMAKQIAKNLRASCYKARILPSHTKYGGYNVWRKKKKNCKPKKVKASTGDVLRILRSN